MSTLTERRKTPQWHTSDNVPVFCADDCLIDSTEEIAEIALAYRNDIEVKQLDRNGDRHKVSSQGRETLIAIDYSEAVADNPQAGYLAGATVKVDGLAGFTSLEATCSVALKSVEDQRRFALYAVAIQSLTSFDDDVEVA